MKRLAPKVLLVGILPVSAAHAGDVPSQSGFFRVGGSTAKFSSSGSGNKSIPELGQYSSINLERWSAEFFDEQGKRTKRIIAGRTDVKAGYRLFSGPTIDLGAGGKVTKIDSKVYYSKPETTLKVDLLKSELMDLKIQSKVIFPMKESLLDPTYLAEGGRLEADMSKAVDKIIISSAEAKAKVQLLALGLFVAGDGCAIQYSKSHHYESVDGRADLNDSTFRYSNKWTLGAGLSMGAVSLEATGAYETRFVPEHYFNTRNKKWEWIYDWERVSYSTVKAVIAPKPSFSLVGEATVIRNGFFEEDRVGDEMRLRTNVGLNVKF
jgi:hypothetical protein